jgi:hypothetical protein
VPGREGLRDLEIAMAGYKTIIATAGEQGCM